MYDRLSALTTAGAAPELGPLMLNNNRRKTGDCIRFIREELTDDVHYVHRELDLEGRHTFRRARLSIWAPEEDTADYYGRLQPLTLGAEAAGADDRPLEAVSPPPGVDVDAFYDLLALRDGGIQANALAIDRAANDTSVVLLLEWDGWRLLFTGDAEHRSWRTMAAAGMLGPVDFIKVAHHGSENGTPTGDLLDRILPMPPPDPTRPRYAVVSTCRDSYPGVPDDRTLSELERRCTVLSTLDAGPSGHLDITFPPG
jgi:hypothetical protein